MRAQFIADCPYLDGQSQLTLYELGIDDLIFYVYPNQSTDSVAVPRDFLLQLHVAVANIGGRKLVLSALRLTHFSDEEGHSIALPDTPMPLNAHRVDQSFNVVSW